MTLPAGRDGATGSPGLLDTAYLLVSASARTALALVQEGPTIVRGAADLVRGAPRVVAELRPVVVDTLGAVPRLVSLL